MKAPVRRLTKSQILWLAEHYCKHRVTFLEHYNCFLNSKWSKENTLWKERVGYLDIETTGFDAAYDYMLSWAILPEPKKEGFSDTKLAKTVLGRTLTPKEIKTYVLDRKLVEELVEALKGFDRIVVFNGVDYRFDIPFARTRALRWGIEFIPHRGIFVEDVYLFAKQKLKMSRRRLKDLCSLFGISAKQHPGEPNLWIKASLGDAEALKYLWKHNVEDVISLYKLYSKLYDYMLHGNRSI